MSTFMALLSIIIITIYLTFKTNYAEIIDTTYDRQFYGQDKTINCKGDENCTVICDTDYGCYQATINCPANFACNIQCVANNGSTHVCDHTKFNCKGSTQCDILCTSDNKDGHACNQGKIEWPINSDEYNIECIGPYSCANMYQFPIQAPNDIEPFNFICNGSNTCQGSKIECPQNATCNIICDGSSACSSAQISCGQTANSQCNIQCLGTPHEAVCQAAKFDGIGTVLCDGIRSCDDMTFPEAPAGIDYYLDCKDEFSCHRSIIVCPMDAECHIKCSGKVSCANSMITWPPIQYMSSLTCLDADACLGVNLPPTGISHTFGPTVSSVVIRPTNQPTNRPTKASTYNYGVLINILFDYNFTNLTDIMLTLLVEDITGFVLNNSINDLHVICHLGNYHIYISIDHHDEHHGTVNITAKLELCYKNDANQVAVYLNDTLGELMAMEINEEPDIILIAIPKVYIKLFEAEAPETTTDILTSTNTLITELNNSEQPQEEQLEIAIIVMIVIICLLIIAVSVLLYLYRNQITIQIGKLSKTETAGLTEEKELQNIQCIEDIQRVNDGSISRKRTTNSSKISRISEPGSVFDIEDDHDVDNEQMVILNEGAESDENENVLINDGEGKNQDDIKMKHNKDETDEELYKIDMNDELLLQTEITPNATPQATPKQMPEGNTMGTDIPYIGDV